jgi:hypothetical protein
MADATIMKPRHSTQKIIYVIAAAGLLALLAFAPRMWDSLCGNEPIRFYGRIVNPSGQPIGGVTVDIEILHYTSPHLSFSGGESVSVERITSDKYGNFELTSGSGHSFMLRRIAKGGQELESAFPPRDPRRQVEHFSYRDGSSKAKIPDTAARRLDFPVQDVR